jgi:hypothetical protein
MKKMYNLQSGIVFTCAFFALVSIEVKSQTTTMPEVLEKGSLKEQIQYIGERTKIFENYRAIREDMFQKLLKNVTDTLSEAGNNLRVMNSKIMSLRYSIDSLKNSLTTTQNSLEEMNRTKNSIRILGMEVKKPAYNAIMWTIIAGLSVLLILIFLAFKRNLSSTNQAKKECLELKDEFEAYRKTTREAREKMSMDHFKEIKKLKGG